MEVQKVYVEVYRITPEGDLLEKVFKDLPTVPRVGDSVLLGAQTPLRVVQHVTWNMVDGKVEVYVR